MRNIDKLVGDIGDIVTCRIIEGSLVRYDTIHMKLSYVYEYIQIFPFNKCYEIRLKP